MKECDILGGQNIHWPLLHIFRASGPPTGNPRIYAPACRQQVSDVANMSAGEMLPICRVVSWCSNGNWATPGNAAAGSLNPRHRVERPKFHYLTEPLNPILAISYSVPHSLSFLQALCTEYFSWR